MPAEPPIRRQDIARMKPLDATDRRLLALLQDNARTPTVALARAVSLSRSAVQERLRRLEREGVIEQYTLRLGRDEPSLQAWLMLRHAVGFSCDDVLPALAALPEMRRCDSLAGEIDLLVGVEVAGASALSDLRERIAALKGVDDVTTVTVLRTLLDRDRPR
jgi:Lrp/AsnC family transcriptional regulator, leucine-responsive regulatory protein